MASKYDKMFPTRKENQTTAQKAAESHRDILYSRRNVFGAKTQELSESYKKRKRRKRPSAPDNADFYNTGKMYKSFRAEGRITSTKKIAYAFDTYLSEEHLAVGLSKGKNYQYALSKGKTQIPSQTLDLIVNDFRKNMKGNLKRVLKKKKDFKVTLTII